MIAVGGHMVGGWDKSPGPNNDYTPKPWSAAKWWVFGSFWALVIVVIMTRQLVLLG